MLTGSRLSDTARRAKAEREFAGPSSGLEPALSTAPVAPFRRPLGIPDVLIDGLLGEKPTAGTSTGDVRVKTRRRHGRDRWEAHGWHWSVEGVVERWGVYCNER